MWAIGGSGGINQLVFIGIQEVISNGEKISEYDDWEIEILTTECANRQIKYSSKDSVKTLSARLRPHDKNCKIMTYLQLDLLYSNLEGQLQKQIDSYEVVDMDLVSGNKGDISVG